MNRIDRYAELYKSAGPEVALRYLRATAPNAAPKPAKASAPPRPKALSVAQLNAIVERANAQLAECKSHTATQESPEKSNMIPDPELAQAYAALAPHRRNEILQATIPDLIAILGEEAQKKNIEPSIAAAKIAELRAIAALPRGVAAAMGLGSTPHASTGSVHYNRTR